MVVTKLDLRRRSSLSKRLFKMFIILALMGGVISIGLSLYVGWDLTHPKKLPLTEKPDAYNLAYEEVSFKNRTGDIELKGWYIPAAAPNPWGTIIMAHGYGKNRLQTDVGSLSLAKSLVEKGYQVLLFDFRNSGESGGSLTTVGPFEKDDLLGAIDWVKNTHPGKTALLGFSMGGSTALLAAAEEPSVMGVVADSPFNHLKQYLDDNLSVWSHLPKIPFTPLILSLMPPVLGFNPNQADALAASDRIYPRPILFIHSVDDDKIPYTNSEVMWAKHQDTFEFWKTSKAGHVGTYKLQQKEYTDRIIAFFSKLQ